ncbi:hypothetical protein LTR08_009295 [Meristemomyces frigidus]|nr:hypothetical protein LTR08_009295 [Meristemomyces frigidus]
MRLPGTTQYVTDVVTTTLLSSYPITYTTLQLGSTQYETDVITTTLLSSYAITETSIQLASTLTETTIATTTLLSSYPITYTSIQPARTLTETDLLTTTQPSSYPVTETTALNASTQILTSTVFVSVTVTATPSSSEISGTSSTVSTSGSACAAVASPTIGSANYILVQNTCAGSWAVVSTNDNAWDDAYVPPDGAVVVNLDSYVDFQMIDGSEICESSVMQGDWGCNYGIWIPTFQTGDVVTLSCANGSPTPPPAAPNTITVTTCGCSVVYVNIGGYTTLYTGSIFTFTAESSSTVDLTAAPPQSVEAIWTIAGGTMAQPQAQGASSFAYTVTQDAEQSLSVTCYPATTLNFDLMMCFVQGSMTVTEATLGLQLSNASNVPFLEIYAAPGHTLEFAFSVNTPAAQSMQLTDGNTGQIVASGFQQLKYQFVVGTLADYYSMQC